MASAVRNYKNCKSARQFCEKLSKSAILYKLEDDTKYKFAVVYDTEENMCRICGKRESIGLKDICNNCYMNMRYERKSTNSCNKTLQIEKLLQDGMMNQSEIAHAVGVSRQYVSMYVKNRNQKKGV